jgi:hypothetical protein
MSEEPFDEFTVNLNVQLLKKDKWDSSRLMDFLIQRLGYEGAFVGGSVKPAEQQEQEFYDNIRDDIMEVILAHYWDGQETDEVDMVALFHHGAHHMAQAIVDSLTKDFLL